MFNPWSLQNKHWAHRPYRPGEIFEPPCLAVRQEGYTYMSPFAMNALHFQFLTFAMQKEKEIFLKIII